MDTEIEKEFIKSYNQYVDNIYRHCYFRVYDKDLAEDITQETFIKTWQYIQKGKKIDNIKSFLYRVAVNLIIDNSRKKKAVVLDDLKDKEVSLRLNNIEGRIFDNFQVHEIMKTLLQLKEKYRQVITLRYIDGFSPGEIADILGESPNAVSVRINYAIKKLKEIIKI